MKTFFLISIFFISSCCHCQSIADTVFFGIDWNRKTSFDQFGYYGFKNYDENRKGMATYYYGTGELHSHQNEVEDQKHGHCTWYFKSGKKRTEGNFINNKPNGEQVWYSENGTIERTQIYNESGEPNTYYYDLTKGQVKDSLVVISQPEIIELFSGYENKIEISYKSGCDFNIGVSCPSCDTVYNIGYNLFVVVPKESRVAFIDVYKILEDDQYELITRKEYRVRSLPDPNLYIGAANQESHIYWMETKLFARYPPEIWLDCTFSISQWTVRIGKKSYSGSGDELSSIVQKKLKKLGKGKRIELSASVLFENNQERTIETFFTRAPNEWYKEFDME